MGLFDRFKKKKEPSEYDRISQMGNDPDAWGSLSDADLKAMVMVKCIEYGLKQDSSLIPNLFALYKYAMTRLDRSERMEMLNQFSLMTEEKGGLGHMGLMMFMAADDDPAIQSTAALSLSVLFDPQGGDELSGPEFVVRTLLRRGSDPESQGAALGGVLLLGDKRVMPLLEDAWSQLSEAAKIALTRANSGFVSEGIVEFWLSCLESGCSEAVFGSLVAAIAKMPDVAQVPFVLDMERLFPAYAGGEPMEFVRKTSFADYLEEIRPRLEALARDESEPKLIWHIYESWENPGRFGGVIR